jgi:type IV secretory pathway VirB10-like protein
MNTEIHNSLRLARRIVRRIVSRTREQSLIHTFSSTSALLIIPVFAMIGFGGCPKQPVKPKFAHTGVTQPPRMPVLNIESSPPDVNSPQLPYIAPQMSSALSNPPRPPATRRATATTEPEPEPTKPEAPQISPQLSAEEKARAQSSIDADVHAAQQALDTASHHTLNSAQQDMADKIRSFLTQTHDAVGVADWLSAKNLAQKAHVLANELVRSF